MRWIGLTFYITVFAVLLSCVAGYGQSAPLETLRSSHPRLLLLDKDLPQIQKSIESDPFTKQTYQKVLARGEAFRSTPPHRYVLQGAGHELLWTARDVEDRIFTLAGLYRLTGQRRFAERARQEMIAASKFPDWNPSHFLDTAELTAALGIGYDWLYDFLSPKDRDIIHAAIVTKGIDPYLIRMRTGKLLMTNNWADVCNGGVLIGALALAEEEPARATEVLSLSHPAMERIMKLYAPDGGFEEGPVYWNYGTMYNTLYISALETALGYDFGLPQSPGFAKTGNYRMQSIGPILKYANFGDAHEDIFPAPQMFWLARKFNRPVYTIHEQDITQAVEGHMRDDVARESNRFGIFALLWYPFAPHPEKSAEMPLGESFERVDQAFLRSSWSGSKAWYLAFKGGDERASHGHSDLGSFVMDALGQRWAIDLGPDSYELPGYFGSERRYYRTQTQAHNTLTVGGVNEDADAKSSLSAFNIKGRNMFAVASLDQCYKGKLKSWRRGIALIDGHRVLLQDEIDPDQAVNVAWNFHTYASVRIERNGYEAILSQGGATLHVRILSPAGARFEKKSAEMPPPQERNAGVTALAIDLSKLQTPQTIAVLFTALDDLASPPVVVPLSEWRAN